MVGSGDQLSIETADLLMRRLGEPLVASPMGSRNQVDPDGDLWMSVLEATGQPPRFS